MSAGATATSRSGRSWKWKPSPRTVSLLIVLFVFCGTLVVRHLGWLQFLEFQAYDFFLRYQPKAATSDPVVIVEMTEADIHSPSLDYPIYDDKLAELLRTLESDQPAVIGLDIWRDIPVPPAARD
jgi:CHASE2 domain-containing sensor protein